MKFSYVLLMTVIMMQSMNLIGAESKKSSNHLTGSSQSGFLKHAKAVSLGLLLFTGKLTATHGDTLHFASLSKVEEIYDVKCREMPLIGIPICEIIGKKQPPVCHLEDKPEPELCPVPYLSECPTSLLEHDKALKNTQCQISECMMRAKWDAMDAQRERRWQLTLKLRKLREEMRKSRTVK